MINHYMCNEMSEKKKSFAYESKSLPRAYLNCSHAMQIINY